MDILGYVENFGHLTFDEKPLNDVDALILSQLSYINFENLAPSIKDQSSKPFYLKSLQTRLIKTIATGEFTDRKNVKLLPLLKTSPRFRNIGITCVENDVSLKVEKQFYALTFILPNNEMFISYRGTDLTLVGWKEDCNMVFLKEIPAQQSAIDYVNRVAKRFDMPFYMGGHSKGGNLSFYSAFYMDSSLCDRCKAVYSFDGPGFYDTSWTENEQYKLIEDKLVKIVPYDSLVGILMNHTRNSRVVDSKSFSVLQHDPYNWKISKKTGDFVYLKQRARASYINERAIKTWLASLTKQELMMTVDVLFELLGGTKASIGDLIKSTPRTIANFFIIHSRYTKEQREKLSEILKRLFYYWRKSRKYYRDNKKHLK